MPTETQKNNNFFFLDIQNEKLLQEEACDTEECFFRGSSLKWNE